MFEVLSRVEMFGWKHRDTINHDSCAANSQRASTIRPAENYRNTNGSGGGAVSTSWPVAAAAASTGGHTSLAWTMVCGGRAMASGILGKGWWPVASLGKGEGVKAVSLQWVGILLAVQLTGQLKMWLIGWKNEEMKTSINSLEAKFFWKNEISIMEPTYY